MPALGNQGDHPKGLSHDTQYKENAFGQPEEVFQTQEMLRVASLDAASQGDDDGDTEGERLDASAFCPEQLTVEDRVVAHRSWEDGSDRDYGVVGRHSPRYYRFATRWMVSEVSLHRARKSASVRAYPRLARTWASAQVGRLGMLLTERERELA